MGEPEESVAMATRTGNGYVVVLKTGYEDEDPIAVYGPFADEGEAVDFAAFLTAEVDPAFVRELSSPAGELLAWRRSVRGAS